MQLSPNVPSEFQTSEFGETLRHLLAAGLARAIEVRDQGLEITAKTTVGKPVDFFTNADEAAQKLVVDGLIRHFPRAGIVAEENGVYRECTEVVAHGRWFFVVDIIDGTKMFAQGEKYGWGGQIALLHLADDDTYTVEAVYVIDGQTGQIIGFDLVTDGLWNHSGVYLEPIERLTGPDPDVPLSQQGIICRGHPFKYDEPIQRLMAPPEFGGLFRRFTAPHGSPTQAVATVLRGNAGAMVLHSYQQQNVWDQAPFVGITERVGLVCVQLDEDGLLVIGAEPKILGSFRREQSVLYVHRNQIDEINWFLNGKIAN
jgi:fructose-1,6-bisphosphatase/inositol monophosphatase family enzyme